MRKLLTALALMGTLSDARAASQPRLDPTIAAIVAKVSAERLKADDARLVAFGTRSTFSEQLGDKRGVFAARSWIADRFRDIAQASHGRMTVAYDSYVQRAAGVDVQGDLNSDIIGASVGDHGEQNPGTVRIFSQAIADSTDPAKVNSIGNESDSPSRELARFTQQVGDRYQQDFHGELVFRADRFLRGGDHRSFNVAGFPAIRFTEPVETFAHQHQDVRTENGIEYGDLQKFMDFDYLARVTRYNVAVLASLAMGPGRPDTASVLTKELDNRTQLTWSAVPGAVSYEVVRRKTTAAIWTEVTDVGNVTAVTLPYSKDNWLFAVRAVDAQGHRGVPAFPLPVR